MADAAEFQETTSTPARRRPRRTATLLIGILLFVALLQLPSAPAAHAAATGSRTVSVSIDSLTPTTPTKSDTLTVTGTVTNDGKSTVSGAQVALRVGPQISGRSALDDVAKRTGYSLGADGTEIGGKYAKKIAKLPAGISRDFSIKIPAKDLNLGSDGIYQLGVALTGHTSSQSYDQVLGIKRTLLPWQPSAVSGKKTKLTVMWPLVSTTHLTARSASDPQQMPVFRNDDLAAEIAPGGRLQQLVSLGKNLPVTWVIDPDLLASVEAMTKNYTVEQPDGTTAPGKGQAVAKQWLHDLQDAVPGDQVMALPFADPDLASLAHRGKDVTGSLSHLQSATELAATTVDTIIGVKPRTDFAWPVDGAIDSSIVDVATSAGAHNVITRSDSLRDSDLPYAPTAARKIGSGNTAIVSDARLSTAFEGDMAKAGNATLAVQQFLAQTLMVTMQEPQNQRSVVVAPQRTPTASQAQAMAAALGALSDNRWTQSVDLGDAAKAKPDPDANQRIPSSGSYSGSLRKQELPNSAFQDIKKTQTTLDGFKVILTAKDRVVTPFGNAIMREMSTSWRGDHQAAENFRGSAEQYLNNLRGQVHLIQKSDATLSGRSATVPVTVKNGLLQGVDGLRLVLTSQQPNRLDVGDSKPITLEGGHSQSVKFETRANANGPVKVTAQLLTEDGQPYGGPMYFTVQVTSITPMVLLVIAVGVLLLVLAGLRIYLKRKRRARDAADGDQHDGDEDNGADAEEPEQPGDPAPDTGSQSTDPSGSGEKVDR
ncbi:DUF6049 family protein [Streptomyces sp. NPDC057654]|uniref:DUF6049 family protein n=1 Tax=Streptomyces sp. NPDC057654 TaxID=3346196 RepID=UPI0036C5F65E